MRRKDREITDINEITDILKKCDVIRLALNDSEYPYIIPLNYGMSFKDKKLTLYFHGAKEGKKLDLIKRNNKASFEVDCSHRLCQGEKACDYSMDYESVCGTGEIFILEDNEKVHALEKLMKQYNKEETYTFSETSLEAVTVYKLYVNNITGKRRMTNN